MVVRGVILNLFFFFCFLVLLYLQPSLLPPHFSRWTMTALRRPDCCSVLLSSVSSLLGKVVMRTNSRAAMAGRAATTNCRRSDTLYEEGGRRSRRRVSV